MRVGHYLTNHPYPSIAIKATIKKDYPLQTVFAGDNLSPFSLKGI